MLINDIKYMLFGTFFGALVGTVNILLTQDVYFGMNMMLFSSIFMLEYRLMLD